MTDNNTNLPENPEYDPQKDLKNPSTTEDNGVHSDNSELHRSPREEIYANHEKTQRETLTLKKADTPDEPELIKEEVGTLNLEVDSDPDPEVTKNKPGPKPKPVEFEEVVVNGTSRLVDKQKVKKHGGKENYQMMVAGQEKLREAAEATKVLEAEKAAFLQQQNEFNKTVQSQSDEPTQNTSDLPNKEDRLRKIAKVQEALDAALDDGNTEAFANAVVDMEEAKGQTVDTEALVKEAERRVRQSMDQDRVDDLKRIKENDVDQAVKDFAIDFPELMGDERLRNLANQETIELQTAHPEWSPSQVLTQAGKNVDEWRNPQGVQDEPDLTSLQKKTQEKRSMQQPTGGSMRSERAPEPQEPTKSDYVRQLQKSRGQPQI